MSRFEILMARYAESKCGSINADLMMVINCQSKVERIKMEMRFAEMELSHAIRGLDHQDYDSIFEGWERV